MCGEARRGCEEVCVELSITLGCDYCMSTAICVMCFYCQAQGRLVRQEALEHSFFTGFLLEAMVCRLLPFAFCLSFECRDDGDNDGAHEDDDGDDYGGDCNDDGDYNEGSD